MGQDVYYSAMRIGKKTYSVKFKFDIAGEGLSSTYKGHQVAEIKISPAVYHTVDKGKTSLKPYARTGDTTVTLSDLTGGVKPKNATAVVDENGEPLVVWHGHKFVEVGRLPLVTAQEQREAG